MSLVSLRDVGVAFGAESVLEGVTLRVEQRQRIAVVGANGAGKTTLLTLISGAREPTRGEVEWQRGLRIGYLPQDAPEPVAETILDEVMASREDLAAMHHEMTTLEPLLGDSTRPDADTLLQRYGDVQHRYIDQGGYELEANAREALGGLGLDTATQQRHPSQLSGGQKRRLELAKLLVQDADLLLIDEPTNHLDLTAIEWLEDFMRGVSTAFVLVSHDRRFLDNVCTQVVEVAGGTVEEYPGNYTQYTKLRVERRERSRREFAAQRAYIDHQEEFIRKYKAGQRAREARGRQTRLDRLERGHLVMHRREVLARRHHLVEDRLRDRFGGILGQIADAQSALPFDLTLGRLTCAADQRQQRCLARAVSADDCDPLACLDTEGDTLEHALGTEGDPHVAEADQGQAATAPPRPRGRRCAARWRLTTRTSSPCRSTRDRARRACEPACTGCPTRSG